MGRSLPPALRICLLVARYLVTGGAGFIGSHIVDGLVARGDAVAVLDNLSTGKLDNLAASQGQITFIEGDLRDAETVRRACDGVEYVLHHGALASVPWSVKDPITSNEVNASGTLNVLVAAREAGVRRVVYAASSAVYGETPPVATREDTPAGPLSPYAVSKHVGELYCQVFWRLYGLETVSLRYFNVFGPRQDPTSEYAAVIPKFITALQRGQAPVIFGDGEQTRDFVYVGNVVQANLLACEAPSQEPGSCATASRARPGPGSGFPAAGQVINIAGGRRISLNELVAVIQRAIGVEIAPVYKAPRPGDIRHSFADISRAREMLGYEVSVPLDEGLARTAAWLREA